jgi:hypothetical protein
VPEDADFEASEFELLKSENGEDIKLASNYSWIKPLISLFQVLYAISTLYQTRGDQISRYGYAAFGLTVTPYAVVSVVNLISSLICPEFPNVFLVRSSVMDEAVRRGNCYFEGVVGKLAEQTSVNLVSERKSLEIPEFKSASPFTFVGEKVPIVEEASNQATDSHDDNEEKQITTVIPKTTLTVDGPDFAQPASVFESISENNILPSTTIIYVPAHPIIRSTMKDKIETFTTMTSPKYLSS